MASEVDICNMALTNIGAEGITALTEPGPEARACSRYYAHTRDMLLQSYAWRWAQKTQSLGEIPNTKEGRWSHAYSIPNDCLKIISIRPPYGNEYEAHDHENLAERARYELEGNTLYTHGSPILLRYIYRVTDPAKFSPLFTDALSWHLAVRLAMPITRDPKMRADAWQVATNMTGQAKEADAGEVRRNTDIVSDYLKAR